MTADTVDWTVLEDPRTEAVIDKASRKVACPTIGRQDLAQEARILLARNPATVRERLDQDGGEGRLFAWLYNRLRNVAATPSRQAAREVPLSRLVNATVARESGF